MVLSPVSPIHPSISLIDKHPISYHIVQHCQTGPLRQSRTQQQHGRVCSLSPGISSSSRRQISSWPSDHCFLRLSSYGLHINFPRSRFLSVDPQAHCSGLLLTASSLDPYSHSSSSWQPWSLLWRPIESLSYIEHLTLRLSALQCLLRNTFFFSFPPRCLPFF